MIKKEVDPRPPEIKGIKRWEAYYSRERTVKADYYRREMKVESYQEAVVETICRFSDIRRKRILETGGGRGGDSIELAKRGAEVVMLDFSRITVDMARTCASERSLTNLFSPIIGNAFDLPFKSESFDIVFHQGFLEHFEDPIPLLKEQYRVLKSGGLLLVDVPQKYHAYTIIKHLLMKLRLWPYGWETQYSYREICKVLQAQKLKIVYSYGWGSLFLPIFKRLNFISGKTKKQKLSGKFLGKIHLALNIGAVGKKLDSGRNE